LRHLTDFIPTSHSDKTAAFVRHLFAVVRTSPVVFEASVDDLVDVGGPPDHSDLRL
jgi:hypothetical protein